MEKYILELWFFLFVASCHCGSVFTCTFSRSNKDEPILAEFSISTGTGENCGVSYLRSAERDQVVKEINDCMSVDVYRAKLSEQSMKLGDPKPPFIRKANVYHVAKSTKLKSEYIDQDPIEALNIMKCTSHANEIHDIRKNPFSVDYWTNEQVHIYKKIQASRNGITISLDSTGLNLKPITNKYGNLKATIFIYAIR